MMRARYPDHDGFVDVDGIKVFYEVFGEDHQPTVFFVHGWQIEYSHCWKMQVPYFARRYRVVTFDMPGNGRSDRPDPDRLDMSLMPRCAQAVLDATGTVGAVAVGHSGGVLLLLALANMRPDLLHGLVLAGGPYPVENNGGIVDAMIHFDDARPPYKGWHRISAGNLQADTADFLEFWWQQFFPEPHSTKAIEDGTGWAMETTPEILAVGPRSLGALMAVDGDPMSAKPLFDAFCSGIRCPVLIVHGDRDLAPIAMAKGLAAATGGELLVLEGCGHGPMLRDPVRFNLAVAEFVERLHPARPAARRWSRALGRRRKVLYLSSPIGLGHARRDVAIARELRASRPDVEIEWLAQHPVTAVLEAAGESIHPASRALAGESAHMESEAGEHDLHCFQALRRMDEILLANFMVTHDLLEDEQFDLVVGDEAWETDYYLHENPELKRAPFCWLTDFVGYLPMPERGSAEAALTADYNAEMIEQVARYPRVRDRAIFVGNADDVVPTLFGPGLPSIREWTSENFNFSGYVTGFPPVADREQLRAELGYRPGESVCVVAVGGSGVGRHLLSRVVQSWSVAARAIDGLRMVVVTGPRIDPTSVAAVAPAGVEVHGFLPDLWKHLAVCDLAVVQGGLTTCMELAANRRRFLYVPLRNHFEQQFHVAHRLQRYRAGRQLDYADTEPDALAAAMVEELHSDVDTLPVETDGAVRAATLIAELL